MGVLTLARLIWRERLSAQPLLMLLTLVGAIALGLMFLAWHTLLMPAYGLPERLTSAMAWALPLIWACLAADWARAGGTIGRRLMEGRRHPPEGTALAAAMVCALPLGALPLLLITLRPETPASAAIAPMWVSFVLSMALGAALACLETRRRVMMVLGALLVSGLVGSIPWLPALVRTALDLTPLPHLAALAGAGAATGGPHEASLVVVLCWIALPVLRVEMHRRRAHKT